MTQPWIVAGAAALGVILAIGALMYDRYKGHQQERNYHQNQSYPRQKCAICQIPIRSDEGNIEPRRCGHLAHKDCLRHEYMKCSFCLDS